METKQKIYAGNGKTKANGKLIKISICLDKIPAEFIKESGGKRYINLDVWQNEGEDQYGNSHSVQVDTWKPSSEGVTHAYEAKKYNTPAQNVVKKPESALQPQGATIEGANDDELPF